MHKSGNKWHFWPAVFVEGEQLLSNMTWQLSEWSPVFGSVSWLDNNYSVISSFIRGFAETATCSPVEICEYCRFYIFYPCLFFRVLSIWTVVFSFFKACTYNSVSLSELSGVFKTIIIKFWSYKTRSDWLFSRFASGYVNTVMTSYHCILLALFYNLKEIEKDRFLYFRIFQNCMSLVFASGYVDYDM